MGQIRIIGGQWKRTPIPVLNAKELRPTPDRVRETLFNWLGQTLNGYQCLDLFAGSGALGLEAASRGATRVVFVEQSSKNAKAIGSLIEKLDASDRLNVVCADSLAWLGSASTQPKPDSFDLIFMDPPFGKGLIEKALPAVLPILAPGGYLYLESDSPFTAGWAHDHGLSLLRADKAGAVHYHLLTRHSEAGERPC